MSRPRPEQAWMSCPGCKTLVYLPRYRRERHVCPECGRHGPLTAPQRLDWLLDPGSASPIETGDVRGDRLGFTDTVPYPDRLTRARSATGLTDAVLCARGTIDGRPVVAVVMDFRFLGGSMGLAVGDAVDAAAAEALRSRDPLLLVCASGGARMQEGALALMQMARASQALAELDDAGVLTVSLLTDPTFGGVAASFATAADVIIGEPGARMGFAGRRVVEQTIGQRLPEEFQSAEFLLRHGLIDGIAERGTLRQRLAALLALRSRPYRVVRDRPDPTIRDPGRLAARDPWQAVRLARALDRPTTREYAGLLIDGFFELRGDRVSGDCPAIVAGLGLLDGRPVALIGNQKGHTLAELAAGGYGMASPSGYRKAARVMRLAAKLGLPVLTLVDTPGAYPGREAEEQGQALRIAENLKLMAGLPVPIVSVVTGEGGSGGALALALADRVLMRADAVYSVISPEGCAAILWKDRDAAPRAAAALRLEARDLLRLGVIDGVLPEPELAGDKGLTQAVESLRDGLLCALDELAGLSPAELVAGRRERFRRLGEGTS